MRNRINVIILLWTIGMYISCVQNHPKQKDEVVSFSTLDTFYPASNSEMSIAAKGDSTAHTKSNIDSSLLSDLMITNISWKVSPLPQEDVEPPINNPGFIYTFLVEVKNIGDKDFKDDLIFTSNLKSTNKNQFVKCFPKRNIKHLSNYVNPEVKREEEKSFEIVEITEHLLEDKRVIVQVNPKECENIPRVWTKFIDPYRVENYYPIKEKDYTNNSYILNWEKKNK